MILSRAPLFSMLLTWSIVTVRSSVPLWRSRASFGREQVIWSWRQRVTSISRQNSGSTRQASRQRRVSGFTMPVRQILADGANTSYLGYQSSGVPWDMTYPTALYPSYPTGGGNLTVKVEGNLISQSTNLGGYAGSELDPYWLWTEPNAASPTWFINFGTYYQDMAY